MKKIFLFALLVQLSLNSFSQWTPQAAPSGTGNLYSVFAINANAVAASGYERIIRTINGGSTWTSNLTITGVHYYEVHTADPVRWFSLALNSTWMALVGNPSGITLLSNKPDSIYSVHFTTQVCGVAAGMAGKIETTCDSGATWQQKQSGTSANLFAVWFADDDTGCICGAGGVIRRTINGGATWNSVPSITAQTLNSIHFPDLQTGYIAGTSGTILKTTDGGANWTALTSGVTNNLNGIFFTSPDTGYVVGTLGLIMKTDDGGANWTPMISGTQQHLNSVHFISPTIGWTVGNNATILKYTAGTTGGELETLPRETVLFPNPVTDQLTLVSPDFRAENIFIYDMPGKKVHDIHLPSRGMLSEITMDVSFLAKGVYVVVLENGSKSVLKKIIKE